MFIILEGSCRILTGIGSFGGLIQIPDDEIDKKSLLSNARRAGKQDSDPLDNRRQLCDNLV
jgi:hypothetical protein